MLGKILSNIARFTARESFFPGMTLARGDHVNIGNDRFYCCKTTMVERYEDIPTSECFKHVAVEIKYDEVKQGQRFILHNGVEVFVPDESLTKTWHHPVEPKDEWQCLLFLSGVITQSRLTHEET